MDACGWTLEQDEYYEEMKKWSRKRKWKSLMPNRTFSPIHHRNKTASMEYSTIEGLQPDEFFPPVYARTPSPRQVKFPFDFSICWGFFIPRWFFNGLDNSS